MLKNPRQERFAQIMAKGEVTAAQAYRLVTKKSGPGARSIAHKWLTKGDVQKRIDQLRAQAAEKSAFDLQQMLEYLIGIVKLKGDEFTKDSPYARVTLKETPEGTVREYAMPDKLKALHELAELSGYFRPQVQESAAQLQQGHPSIIINLPPLLMQPRRVAGKTIETTEEKA